MEDVLVRPGVRAITFGIAAVVLGKNREVVSHKLDVVGHEVARLGEAVDAKFKGSSTEDPYLRELFDDI